MIAVVFLVVVMTSVLAYLLVSGRLATKERAVAVRRVTGREAAAEKSRAPESPALIEMAREVRGVVATRLLERLRIRKSLEQRLEAAALKWGAAGLTHRAAGLFLAGFLAATVATRNAHPVMALGAGAVLATAPFVYMQKKAAGRVRKFEEQFPDCLEFISRSMRAGHAFSVSLDLVHREFSDPLAGEFRRAFEEQNLGQPLEIVLRKLGQRIPSMDVQFFISAVLMQRRTGGNLAELLDRLAQLIRERFKLRARVRAISAMGLMSGRVLAAIPASVAALMFVVNRSYVQFFIDDPVGHQLVAAALGMQLLGYLIIRKMATIEV